MDKSFHYMIMVNQSLFQKKVLDALSPYKLTAGQPKVLDYLGRHNGCIQKAIATGCQIEPATLTGILSRMEEKKLIKRQTKDGNKRSLYVSKMRFWAEFQKVKKSSLSIHFLKYAII